MLPRHAVSARRSDVTSTMSQPTISAVIFTLVMVICLPASGCRPQNAYFEPPPPEVPVASPRQDEVTDYIYQTGTTQAFERVQLRSRVSGFLVERKFNDGDVVKKGQVLFVIDEVPFKVALRQAKARQSEAEAALLQSRQSKTRETTRAKLKLSQADLSLAKTSLDRARSLVERSAIPQQDLDRTVAEYDKAVAQVDSDRADVEQMDADYETRILSLQASLDAATENVKAAELELSYCQITSPLEGRVDARVYDVGNYIMADSNPLATVVQLNPIYVNITPSSAELVRMRAGEVDSPDSPIKMQIGVDGSNDFPFEGVVDYIAPIVDESTGTVRVRGLFQNTEEKIMPGLLVRVRIPASIIKDAVLVPDRAIGFDQSGGFVYVIGAENKVERRPVTTGPILGHERVVSGPVTISDKVVIDGLIRVRPGLVVAPKDASPVDKETVPATPVVTNIAE